MKLLFILSIIIILIALSKSVNNVENFQSQSSKSSIKQSYFDKLDVKSLIEVIITQGDEEIVEIEGPDSVFRLIEVKVRYNTLFISTPYSNRNLIKYYDKARIYVTCVNLREIKCSRISRVKGDSFFFAKNIDISVSDCDLNLNLIASNVSVTAFNSNANLNVQSNSVKADVSRKSTLKLNGETFNFVADVSGSSDVESNLDSNYTNVTASGKSTVKLSGMTDSLKAKISGYSDLNAFSLTAREADVKVTGVSEAKLTVTDYLGYEVRRSSFFIYNGKPYIYKKIYI